MLKHEEAYLFTRCDEIQTISNAFLNKAKAYINHGDLEKAEDARQASNEYNTAYEILMEILQHFGKYEKYQDGSLPKKYSDMYFGSKCMEVKRDPDYKNVWFTKDTENNTINITVGDSKWVCERVKIGCESEVKNSGQACY